MAKALNSEQLTTLLNAIVYRATYFPRAQLRSKLDVADRMYHLAKTKNTTDNSDGVPPPHDGTDNRSRDADQDYSRYQEIQSALTREIGETYAADYVTTFLADSKVFAMTSSEDRQEDSQKFNVVFSEQSKRTGWSANLSKTLLDVAKYNLGATDTYWGGINYYQLTRLASKGFKPEKTRQTWKGNFIKHIDMYNIMFDLSVSPDLLSKKGEWAMYLEIYSQVELKKLMDLLRADEQATLYDYDPRDRASKTFNIYKVNSTTLTTNGTIPTDSANNMNYSEPEFTPSYGSDAPKIDKFGGTNWFRQFGGTDPNKKNAPGNVGNRYYTVAKCYLRLIPSAYGFPDEGKEDGIQIMEVYILEGTHILGTKVLEDAHELLPIDIAIADCDSLGINAAGPTQVSIPYSTLSKQITDRILAGADRAISDRALVDGTYLSESVVNSKIPDAKMFTKAKLPLNKKLSDIYEQIPFDGAATRNLNVDKQNAEESGRRAAGLNQAQQGQFVKGNKTLFEFEDVMANADSKIFFRNLFLEHSFFVSIKNKIKLNIIQYQDEAKLIDPTTREEITVKPEDFYNANVEFQIIDKLMPSEYVMSPNAQQALFTMFGQLPEAFAEMDIAGMVTHILSQSYGINMEQYKKVNQGDKQ